MPGAHRRPGNTPPHGIDLVERAPVQLVTTGRHAIGSHPALVPAMAHLVASDITCLLPAVAPSPVVADLPMVETEAPEQPAAAAEVAPRRGWLTKLRGWLRPAAKAEAEVTR